MDRHIRILALIYIAGGIAGALVGCALLFQMTAVSQFLLALLSARRVGSIPFAALYLNVLGWLHLALLAPAVLSGWGLRRYDEWARLLGLVVAMLALLSFPFGTLGGVYAIWVLLSPESEYLFLEPPGLAGRH